MQKLPTTTQKVQEAQQAMLEGQELLGDAVLAEYKSDGGLSLVNIVLTSETISDFVTNMTYYSAVQEDQAEKIAEQRQLNETFNEALDDLNEQRDNQQAVLDKAEAKKVEAEKVVSDASAKVSSIKESQAELAKLQAQADQMATMSLQTVQSKKAQIGTLTTSVPLQEGVLPIVAVLAIAGLRTLQKDGRAVLLLPMVDLLILILQTLELLLSAAVC